MAPAVVTPRKTPVVLVCDRLSQSGMEILQAAGLEVRDLVTMAPVPLVEAVADVDAIIVRSATKISESILDAAGQLRVVGRAGIGVDNIDVAAATRHGVLVMNTPLGQCNDDSGTCPRPFVRPGASYSRRRSEHATVVNGTSLSFVGTEISGKVLTIIGLGKIGRIVAEKALGLGMKVQAFDPFLTRESPLPGVKLVDWETGLKTADFVTIHVPKSQATESLVGSPRIRLDEAQRLFDSLCPRWNCRRTRPGCGPFRTERFAVPLWMCLRPSHCRRPVLCARCQT